MASNEPGPAIWDDDEKKVFFLPATEPAVDAGQAAEPAADRTSGESRVADDPDADLPFPGLVKEDGKASAQVRIEPVRDPEERPMRPVEHPANPPAQALPEEEPFDRPGTTRVGLLGGKGVGKSYLFQAMVYRTLDGKRAGALSYYIDRDSVRVYQTLDRNATPRSVIPSEFIHEYTSWMKLHSTTVVDQQWYRLRLQFRTGLLGVQRAFLDIDFLDGSGESFESGISTETGALWKAAFLEARIMVFCLPMWAAFPAAGGVLSDADWEHRERMIKGFDAVVRHFRDLREKYRASHPVRSILALTMADDRRSALATLRSRWVTPFLENPKLHQKAMRSASGVARYLSNARRVSEALWQEFDASPDPRISGIPERIEFGAGRPWFIPVSAIDGAVLEAQAQRQVKRGHSQHPPVPIHVELPLLVALCESHNALM